MLAFILSIILLSTLISTNVNNGTLRMLTTEEKMNWSNDRKKRKLISDLKLILNILLASILPVIVLWLVITLL